MAIGAINISVSCSTCDRTGITGKKELTEDERRQVVELKKRDQEVKAHEAAHMAAGGAYIRGGASYSYQTGPDGRRYAVGGEVSIDTTLVSGDPQATIQKMQTVKRAALAPANPSGQDRAVAAAATAIESKAQQEKIAQQKNEQPKALTERESDGEIDSNELPPQGIKGTQASSAYQSTGRSKAAAQSEIVNLLA